MEDTSSSFLNGVALVPNQTYNYSNSSVFYSLVSYQYQNYYKQVIKSCQEWLDGFVPSFHISQNGIVSTRIAAKITKGITNQLFGRGLIYVNGKNTTERKGIEYISHTWQDECDFQNNVKTLIGYTIPLGTALLKINRDSKGKLWVEPVRADYFYFSADSRNKLQDVTIYIRTFSDTVKNKNYCLVEHRYFKTEKVKITENINGEKYEFETGETKEVPMCCYKVFQVNSTSDNNNLAANTGKGINYKQLPDEVKKALKENYGNIILDQEIVLPFDNYLGCELFKNEGNDITHPSTPFGSPMLFDLISDFMEYDMDKSYAIRDLYNSKGIVGVPKSLTQSQIVPGTAGNMQVVSPFSQLNIPGYETIPGLNPDNQKPVVTQFEIRAAEHETKQNAILKSIATSIGMSPRVIASYLVNGNEKTAEQTHSEDDTVTNWIKTHRQDYIPGLNRIIETVLSYNGIVDNVEVRFASDGLMNEERRLENIKARMEMGLLSLEDAVREYYTDLDEVQLKQKIDSALKQQQLNQEQQASEFDEMFGDKLNNENEFNE